MTPSALPQICWRPLAEVKAYVEKFPDGIDLTTLESRVNTYSKLSRKDKQKLITHLEQRESILVIKANKTGKVGRPKLFYVIKNTAIQMLSPDTTCRERNLNQNQTP